MITDLFIRRPILSSSLSLLILILGLNAALGLPVRQYPQLRNTTITITTAYTGATQDLMQGFVTQPIQQAVAGVENVDYITSSSRTGLSTISMVMRLNADPNAALAETIGKVQSVRAKLPREIIDPVVTKTTGSAFSIMYLSFTSDRHSPEQISDYLARVVQPKTATVPGVAQANILAEQPFAMRIWLDPQRLAGFGITAAEVRQALAANNYQTAAGQIRGYLNAIDVDVRTSLNDPVAFAQLIVATRKNDQIVRLSDVATVTLGARSNDQTAYANGRNAVFIGIDPTPSANPLEVAKGVRALMPSIERDLPQGMGIFVAYDSTTFISKSIDEVVRTFVEAIVIVCVVILLFLGSLRAVLIPILTIPLSIIGVCVLLQAMGFSINLLTLLALVLAIGLVVDDAIVVVENVDRNLREGLAPIDAALVGTREIAVPVVSMTLTLAAVYAPIALTTGLTGALFQEFALTLAGAVFVSGVVALTLSPMLSARLLRHSERPGLLMRLTEGFLGPLERVYAAVLRLSLRIRPVIALLALGVLGVIYIQLGMIRSELAPGEDQSVVLVLGSAPAEANADYIGFYAREIQKQLDTLPERESSFMLTGIPAPNQVIGGIVLKPWEERTRTDKAIIGQLFGQLGSVQGMRASPFAPAALPGSEGGLPIQFVVTTTADFRTLAGVMERLQGAAWGSGLFAFVDNDLKFESPMLRVAIDRDKAGAYGVTAEAIGVTIGTMMSNAYVNRMSFDGRSYEVIPQVPRGGRLTPESLGQYYVRAMNGAAVPLSNLITTTIDVQPTSLPQFNQLNAATLSAAPLPGVTQGMAYAFLARAARDALPEGFGTDTKGETRQFVKEGAALYVTFGLALAIIFLVLAMQFESFRDPLVILISVPLATVGALTPLALGWTTMNIYSQVGLITLIGLITKHGILICEVAKVRQEKDGLSRREAVEHAAVQRLRPILMTTAAMVAGLVPLLLASGAGAASRYSIGVVIVAGLSVGTLFTLFVLPTMYSYIASDHRPKAG